MLVVLVHSAHSCLPGGWRYGTAYATSGDMACGCGKMVQETVPVHLNPTAVVLTVEVEVPSDELTVTWRLLANT